MRDIDMTKACIVTVTDIGITTEDDNDITDGVAFTATCPFHGTHTYVLADIVEAARFVSEVTIYASLVWGDDVFERAAWKVADTLMDRMGLPKIG